MNLLRWVATPFTAIFGWCVALVSGVFSMGLLERWCPLGRYVAEIDYCEAPLWQSDAVVLFFIGLSAVLTILFGFYTPPSRRPAVAWLLLLAGGMVAGELARWGAHWDQFFAAIVPGLVTASALAWRYRAVPGAPFVRNTTSAES